MSFYFIFCFGVAWFVTTRQAWASEVNKMQVEHGSVAPQTIVVYESPFRDPFLVFVFMFWPWLMAGYLWWTCRFLYDAQPMRPLLQPRRSIRLLATPISCEASKEECTICHDRAQDVQLECKHLLCNTCLQKMGDHGLSTCPFCRKQLQEKEEEA